MNWYVAKLIFRITCGNGNHQPQFDGQYIEMSNQKALLIEQNQNAGASAAV